MNTDRTSTTPRWRGRLAISALGLAAVLATASAVAAQPAQRFQDVPPDHEAFEAVEWAANVGVTLGYDDGTFKPERPLIKRHALVFMERYYDEILQADESEDFTRGDMMIILKAINDGSPPRAEPTPTDERVFSSQGTDVTPAITLTAGRWRVEVELAGNISKFLDIESPDFFGVTVYGGDDWDIIVTDVAASGTWAVVLSIGDGILEIPAGEVYFEVEAGQAATWEITVNPL